MAGIDLYTKLLLHGDGEGTTFVDSSLNPKTITPVNNITQSATRSKFGSKSLYAAGINDYLSIADHDDFVLGSQDFTIDCWVYPTNLSGNKVICSQYTDNTHRIGFWHNPDNGIRGCWRDGGSSDIYFFTQNGAFLTINAWNHIALVRNGDVFTIYKNGTAIRSQTNAWTFPNYTGAFLIGKEAVYSAGMAGCYLDEFRLSIGIARWTENFTPPTEAYSPDSGSAIKTINDLAIASIKTVNNLAITNMKTWNGLA